MTDLLWNPGHLDAEMPWASVRATTSSHSTTSEVGVVGTQRKQDTSCSQNAMKWGSIACFLALHGGDSGFLHGNTGHSAKGVLQVFFIVSQEHHRQVLSSGSEKM